MTVDKFEQKVIQVAAYFAYIYRCSTVDKTTNTVKLRLHITSDSFIQVYANTVKDLYSYALVLHRQRLYGRDCEGGIWHRHPHHNPADHDISPEGSKPISIEAFLTEAEHILMDEGIL